MTRGIARNGGVERLCLAVSAWPEHDWLLWRAALVPGTPFDDHGARADLRPITNRGVEKSYGRWLYYLAQHEAGALAEDPAARITPERVRRYIGHLMECKNHLATIALRIEQLRSAARVMDPGADWVWLKRPASNLRQRSRPKRDKRERLVAASDLHQLGLCLMGNAPLQSAAGRQAVEYRDGLMIAFLACVPIRLKNLTDLTLGQTVKKVDGQWLVCLPGSQTKTGQPYEVAWPDALVSHLEQYLDVWRPRLAARRRTSPIPAGDQLWISAEGRPLSAKRINHAFKLHTEVAFGRRVNPHLFRDAGATTMALVDPAHIGVMTAVLGHANPNTMERHYQQATTLQAQRALAWTLRSIRHGDET